GANAATPRPDAAPNATAHHPAATSPNPVTTSSALRVQRPEPIQTQNHQLAARRDPHPQPRARSRHDAAPTLQLADPLQHLRALRLRDRTLASHAVQRTQHLECTALTPDDQAQRRQQDRERERETDHSTRTAHHAAFRHARRRALRERGLRSTSSGVGATGRRVSTPPSGSPRQRHTGSSGGQTHPRLHSRNASFTRRSSSEWYEITTKTPPGSSRSRSAGSARSSAPSSSFTAIRNAWKILALSCVVSWGP